MGDTIADGRADALGGGLEGGLTLLLEATRAGQGNLHDIGDAAGPRAHHHHPVGQQHGLGDGMGDEQHGGAGLLPNS